jgi:hypothetical protein
MYIAPLRVLLIAAFLGLLGGCVVADDPAYFGETRAHEVARIQQQALDERDEEAASAARHAAADKAHHDALQAMLDSYFGRTIAEVIAIRGYPTSWVQLPARRLDQTTASFRWEETTGTRPAMLMPVGDMAFMAPPADFVCTVTVSAHAFLTNPEPKDWFIDGASLEGAC